MIIPQKEIARMIDKSELISKLDSNAKKLALSILDKFDFESSEKDDVKHYPIAISCPNTLSAITDKLMLSSEAMWLSFIHYVSESVGEKYGEDSVTHLLTSSGKIGKIRSRSPRTFAYVNKPVFYLQPYAFVYESEEDDNVKIRCEINFGIEIY